MKKQRKNKQNRDPEVADGEAKAGDVNMPEAESCIADDVIEGVKKRRKRKRKSESIPDANPQSETAAAVDPADKSGDTCGHRAGFDAFMTGFSFATYITAFGTYPVSEKVDAESLNMTNCANCLHLARKDFPLKIVKSVFAKNSAEHLQKIKTLDNS